MARLHFVRRARKARRKHGIKRGMSYFWWKFYNCPMQFSKARPRPSRLTRSEFLGAVLAAQEGVEDAVKSSPVLCFEPEDDENGDDVVGLNTAKDAIIDAIKSARDAVQEQLDLCSERADNVEERFPNGCPSLELLRERVEQCEELVDELEAAVSEVESAETVEEVESAVKGVAWEVS